MTTDTRGKYFEKLPGQLDIEDFMAMDVHKPATQEDFADINPQALLDKSAVPTGHTQEMPATFEHEPDTGPVDDTAPPVADAAAEVFPYETPLPDNVVQADVNTSHDLPAETVLRNAFKAKMVEMVVCGIDIDGNEYVLHTAADPAFNVWHLNRAIHIINLRMDRLMMEKHGTLDGTLGPEIA